MTAGLSDGSAPDLAGLLPWLVEMGADEILLDQPVNRLVAAPAARPEPAKPRAVAAPKPVVNWKAVAQGAEGLAAAEALTASIASLDVYAEALENFELHPLKKTAGHLAALGGNLEARVLVLCDKPRNAEDKTGDVLAGDNRLLASRMLAAIGQVAFAEGETVAVANFIPWRPPGNRMPTEQEALMLVPFARRLIALVEPKAILCFGHLPAQYLAGGEDAAVKARGKWVEIDGVPALTTFHPDSLLKSPAWKRLAWADLQAFRQKLVEIA